MNLLTYLNPWYYFSGYPKTMEIVETTRNDNNDFMSDTFAMKNIYTDKIKFCNNTQRKLFLFGFNTSINTLLCMIPYIEQDNKIIFNSINASSQLFETIDASSIKIITCTTNLHFIICFINDNNTICLMPNTVHTRGSTIVLNNDDFKNVFPLNFNMQFDDSLLSGLFVILTQDEYFVYTNFSDYIQQTLFLQQHDIPFFVKLNNNI